MELRRETFTEETINESNEYEPIESPYLAGVGMFPDEILLSYVDRLMYFFGADGVGKYFQQKSSDNNENARKSKCRCSNKECPSEHESFRTCTTKRSETNYSDNSKCVVNVANKCYCSKCQRCVINTKTYEGKPQKSKSTISVNSICSCLSQTKQPCNKCKKCPKAEIRFCDPELPTAPSEKKTDSIFRPLRRSFSLCSLACRKLKEKLNFGGTNATTNEAPSANSNPMKWIWNRTKSNNIEADIYELFSEATNDSKWCSKKHEKFPHIVFIVLSSGNIIPFETVNAH